MASLMPLQRTITPWKVHGFPGLFQACTSKLYVVASCAATSSTLSGITLGGVLMAQKSTCRVHSPPAEVLPSFPRLGYICSPSPLALGGGLGQAVSLCSRVAKCCTFALPCFLSQNPPQIHPFRPEDFLKTLEHAGPQLTCVLKGDWMGLYRYRCAAKWQARGEVLGCSSM